MGCRVTDTAAACSTHSFIRVEAHIRFQPFLQLGRALLVRLSVEKLSIIEPSDFSLRGGGHAFDVFMNRTSVLKKAGALQRAPWPLNEGSRPDVSVCHRLTVME